MDDRFTIHVTIADRLYPLRNIRREDEALMRNAADLVNKTYTFFQEKFKGGENSPQQLLEMTAFEIALKLMRLKENKDIDTFTEILEELDKKMNDYLTHK